MKKLLLIISVLLVATQVWAVTPVPLTEGVAFSSKLAGTLSGTLTVYAEPTASVTNSATAATVESTVEIAHMRPGKRYTFNISGSGSGTYYLSFKAPDGHAVYIDNLPADLISETGLSGAFNDTYDIEIRSLASSSGGEFASFTGVNLGKSITWGVNLGNLRTGRTAGRLLYKEADLSTSPAIRERLYYAEPANDSQIVVIKDGPSIQRLRQIVVPVGFVDIVDVTNGFELRFYTWSQASWSGSIYTFTGSAWKTIEVLSSTGQQLTITETEGSVVRKSHLTETGYVTTGPGATGGTISTKDIGGTDYTIHTFNSSGTFTVNGGISTVDYLVVGGGGGGAGHNNGGGGGGGSVEYLTGQTLVGSSFSVTVGAGGGTGNPGLVGGNSSFNGTTGYGGGYGTPSNNQTAGGSGGGGNSNITGQFGNLGSNVYAGGGGNNSGAWEGGGGGGAGGNTQNRSQGGGTYTGAAGLSNSITGVAEIYGSGGGGGTIGGARIAGGTNAGAGGYNGNSQGLNGTPNKGGGGGGGAAAGGLSGGTGGSGVVIVRYATPTGSAGDFTWTLKEGGSSTYLRTTVHDSTPGTGARDVEVSVYTGDSTSSGDLVTKTKFHYVDKAWGEELGEVIADPDGATPANRTTTYDYHDTAPSSGSETYRGNYMRVKSITKPGGMWSATEYYDDWARRGQIYREYSPFADSSSTVTFTAADCRIVEYDYGYDWTGRFRRLSDRKVMIEGTSNITKKLKRNADYWTGGGTPRKRYLDYDYSDATYFVRTAVQQYRSDAGVELAGLPLVHTAPDVAKTVWSYSRGTYNPTTKVFTISASGDHWRTIKVNGSDTSAGGATAVTTFDSQTFDSIYMLSNKSTLEVSIRIGMGVVYRTETHVYTGSGFSLMQYADMTYDGNGRLTQSIDHRGATVQHSYTDGRLISTTGVTGTKTIFHYDFLGRVDWTKLEKATAATYTLPDDIYTYHEYDGAGRVVKTITSASSTKPTTPGALDLVSTTDYDLAGRVEESDAPGGYTTEYAYDPANRKVTVTLPGGGTKITETYYDGQVKSVTGTAVVENHVTYTLNTTPGTITKQVKFGSSTSTNWIKTTTDWMGRQITEVKPGWNGTDVTRTWTYDTYYGYLNKLEQEGMADTLYTYDTIGGLVYEGLDVSGNGALNLDGDGAGSTDATENDRVTKHEWTFFLDGSDWWSRKKTLTYATAGSGTATETSKVEQQISGFTTNQHAYSKSYDIYGNETTQSVVVDRTNKKVTTTTDAPDSNVDAVQVAYNGLTVSSKDTAGITMEAGYDALGRPSTSIDPRTGTTTTAYKSGTSEVSTVTDPTSVVQATYAYDSAGRVSSLKNGDDQYTYYAYNTRGQKTKEWGDATYPVETVYDDYGRQEEMKTYASSTADFTTSTWPASPGTAAVTTWNYDAETGFVSSKEDADGKEVEFTYTQAGQIKTRAWARILTGSTHVTTTYTYSATTGELLTQDYNDSTPDVTYTYNRLGQSNTVADATGTRTFTYNLAGTLEQQYEALGTFYGTNRRLFMGYDTTGTGTKGRLTVSALGDLTDYALYQWQGYTYKTDGRLDTTTGRADTATYGTRAFTYAYETDSHLIKSVTSGSYTDTRTYESDHNWTATRETKWSTTTQAKFAYTQDDLGRVTETAKTSSTGGIYDIYGNGTEGLTTYYGYDDQSQLTSEVTKIGTGSTILTGRNDSSYAYDQLGNRDTVTHNGDTATYTVNNVNEYTQRTVPGYFDVAGAAGTGATVTVNASSTGVSRHGEYFFKKHGLTNTSNPVYSTLTVSDGTTTTYPLAYVAKTPEAFGYDDDGNLTSDDRWDYTYDAENRLIEMVADAATIPVANKQKLEFVYDYLGRRVQKITYSRNVGDTAWVEDTNIKYVYQGWNLIAEMEGTTFTKNYFWGLDLSGTSQGAGGVGGLLMIQDNGDTLLPAYDAMGNVHALMTVASATINGTSYSAGDVVAAYEYDAFGKTLRESGAYALDNSFRFSTKYHDLETGLVYYGHRYYSPSLGRFINRDPIEEQGGINLYSFVGNNGVNAYDYLGMNSSWYQWDAGTDSYYWVEGDGMDGQDHLDASIKSANALDWMSQAAGAAAAQWKGVVAIRNGRAAVVALKALNKGIKDKKVSVNKDKNGTPRSFSAKTNEGRQIISNVGSTYQAVTGNSAYSSSVTLSPSAYNNFDRIDKASRFTSVKGQDADTPLGRLKYANAMGDILESGTSFGDAIGGKLDSFSEDQLIVQFGQGVIPAGNDFPDPIVRIDATAGSFVGEVAFGMPYNLPRSEVATGPKGAAVTLGHELGHALFDYDDPWSMDQDGVFRETGVSRDQNVITYENQLRDAFDLAPRETYHGKSTLVD